MLEVLYSPHQIIEGGGGGYPPAILFSSCSGTSDFSDPKKNFGKKTKCKVEGNNVVTLILFYVRSHYNCIFHYFFLRVREPFPKFAHLYILNTLYHYH